MSHVTVSRSDAMPVDDATDFWTGGKDGKLVLRWCNTCEAPFHYPRPFCPRCWSTDLEWRQMSGYGVVYAATVVRQNGDPKFKARLPYVIALVDLDEGPRLLANVETTEPVTIGQRVFVDFRHEENDTYAPVFRPVTPS